MATYQTVMSGVEQSKSGKWSVSFDNFVTARGETYLGSSCASAPVFATKEEAEAGGARALKKLEETGRFPNMCEAF